VTAHLPVGQRWAENRLLQVLVLVYAALWLWAAWAPVDRETWVLENFLVVAVVALLAIVHRRFAFSNLSNLFLFSFLLLHAVGSHYTYSAVPAGDWLRDGFDLSRNHYDRVVHFGFGLLLAYPLRELTLRRVHAHGVWSFIGPVMAVLALSGCYEIIEWGAARAVNPELGMAYVGAQGDVWDGQKDMILALTGACLAMAATALVRRLAGHEPYLLLAAGGSR
jgi:putative membrane protein